MSTVAPTIPTVSAPSPQLNTVLGTYGGMTYYSEVGGLGGQPFKESFSTKVIGVKIRHGTYVDSIQMVYSDAIGNHHGGHGGILTMIHFEEDEEITQINLLADWYIDSIEFVTNKKTYGPYGGHGGKAWSAKFAPNELIGIFGRAATYLDSIGFNMRRRH